MPMSLHIIQCHSISFHVIPCHFRTALIAAAEQGHTSVVEYLVNDASAEVDAKDSELRLEGLHKELMKYESE